MQNMFASPEHWSRGMERHWCFKHLPACDQALQELTSQ